MSKFTASTSNPTNHNKKTKIQEHDCKGEGSAKRLTLAQAVRRSYAGDTISVLDNEQGRQTTHGILHVAPCKSKGKSTNEHCNISSSGLVSNRFENREIDYALELPVQKSVFYYVFVACHSIITGTKVAYLFERNVYIHRISNLIYLQFDRQHFQVLDRQIWA
jgi:hypothetical protein